MKKRTKVVGDFLMGKIEMNNHLLELTQYLITTYKLQDDPFVVKKMTEILNMSKSDKETIKKLEEIVGGNKNAKT